VLPLVIDDPGLLDDLWRLGVDARLVWSADQDHDALVLVEPDDRLWSWLGTTKGVR
jgi:hypothetical protein